MFELWPENVESFRIFAELETQWHAAVGLGGVIYIGLIHSEATNLMAEMGLPRGRRLQILGDLRAMERAALPVRNGVDQAEEDA